MDIYTTTIAVSVAIYIVIGNYAGRSIKRLDDYYVAGRRVPTLIIVGTLVASVMSSTMFLGYVGILELPSFLNPVLIGGAASLVVTIAVSRRTTVSGRLVKSDRGRISVCDELERPVYLTGNFCDEIS